MTSESSERRIVNTGALARVEGEGAMRVEIVGDELAAVHLDIYEPPRFFEALLRGRSYAEPPDITARICGICPVAYQLSASAAIEDALDLAVDGQLRNLRHLLYCGEWIESHTLHIHLLHAPDFVGCDSVIELADVDRAAVERGLEIKRIGNRILEVIGGRAIHPVNVRVGGFHRAPTTAEVRALRADLVRGLELADDVVDWVAGLLAARGPGWNLDHELVAVDHPTEYPMIGRSIRSDRGLAIDVADLLDHVEEYQVERSTALHARLLERGRYLVGPLARYGLASDKLAPRAAEAARRAGLGPVCRDPFASIVVRAVEVVHAFATAIDLVDSYRRPVQPTVPLPADGELRTRAGPDGAVGHGVTEAPRGLLYHRYRIDGDGLVSDAVIVPPTAQNQPAIERDLWAVVERNLDQPDDELRRLAEMTIRNHDPCISCATHFLDLTVERS